MSFLILLAASSAEAQLLPNPTITNSAPGFPGYTVNFALDGNTLTDYASLGQGNNTFIDFSFGGPKLLKQVNYTDRTSSGGANGSGAGGSGDNVTAFDLILSNDSIFGNADDTTVNVLSPGFANTDLVIINGGNGLVASFLRWDVTSSNGANVGAAEFQFFGVAVPEPGSVAMWLMLGAVLVTAGVVRQRAKL